MAIGIFFAAEAFFFVVYGLVVAEFGFIQPAVETANQVLEPGGGGILDNILAPFKWGWEAAKIFFQFITFQIVGVPQVIGIPIGTSLGLLNIYLIYRAIRGGG